MEQINFLKNLQVKKHNDVIVSGKLFVGERRNDIFYQHFTQRIGHIACFNIKRSISFIFV